MWEKLSRNRESQEESVTAQLSLSDKIKVLGDGAENRNDLFRKAASRAGISYSQAKRIFYGETADPKSSVRERIERAITKLNEKAAAHARTRAEETADVGRLIARAVEVDADLRREVLALILRKFTGNGPEDRPVDHGLGD
jgi:hypothetical protein